jgi:phosphoglycolate phosphatase
MKKGYILWDWNGTLLDDTDGAIETLNDMLLKRSRQTIGKEFYRSRFSFPVKKFYTEIGVVLENEDWDELAKEYHDIYATKPKCLAKDAMDALEFVAKAGWKQSIISALRQDLLDAETARFGVYDKMEYVFGVDNLDGRSKVDRAKELLSIIRAENGELSSGQVVLIGDSLHDASVADALGVSCVLYSNGTHSRERLEKVGTVCDTLVEAVGSAIEKINRVS